LKKKSHNFINFVSGLKNSSKDRKLRIWKTFNSHFTITFEMILVKMVASNIKFSPQKSMCNLKAYKYTLSFS
jgi:hypothetical protein